MTTPTTRQTGPRDDSPTFHYHIIPGGEASYVGESPPIEGFDRACRLARSIVEMEAARRDVDSPETGPRWVERTQYARRDDGANHFHDQIVAGFGFFTDEGEALEFTVRACQDTDTMDEETLRKARGESLDRVIQKLSDSLFGQGYVGSYSVG